MESIIAGLLIRAHADFAAVVTMNEDASTYEVPDYNPVWLQPTLGMGFPHATTNWRFFGIILPFAPADMLAPDGQNSCRRPINSASNTPYATASILLQYA